MKERRDAASPTTEISYLDVLVILLMQRLYKDGEDKGEKCYLSPEERG